MEITERWLRDHEFKRRTEVKFEFEFKNLNENVRAYIDASLVEGKWIAWYRVAGYKASNDIDTVEGIVLLTNAIMRGGKNKVPDVSKPAWGGMK